MTATKNEAAQTKSAAGTGQGPAERGSDQAGKYLTFKLAGEEYGLEILKVKEIIGMMSITRVPRTPGFVRGVINLRGKVIPVIDLRAKFGMESTEDTDETCIIVVEIARDGSEIQTGILVDTVSEVLDILEKDIEDAPEFGEGIETKFILGMAKSKGDVKILLNIEEVLTAEDFSLISDIKHRAGSESQNKVSDTKAEIPASESAPTPAQAGNLREMQP